MNKQFYFPVPDLMAEAEEKAAYRAKSATVVPEGLTPELLLLSEEDYPMLNEYLRDAADNVYTRLQTLMRNDDPYTFVEDEKVVYNFTLPERFDQNSLPVMSTVVKNYLVEGILMGFYTERGFEKGMQLAHVKMEQLYDKLQRLRITRKGGTKRKYTMI